MQTSLGDLLLVLAYDSEHEKVFTCWERMYIHRQRARLFAELEPDTPPRLKEKIREVQKRIKAISWKPSLNEI
ncbi:hypothetical protein EDL98_11285 [Ornithobacterium rhinotracheale]|uniref:hypothetical protein n=1 Tax=Ornithobacterium rhinotracheale TaxID=28251 RepID=UPI00129CD0DA|nr:hypothetical protein [Ornithobacterium rhinotracheale]MRJ10469.1 hypothetical protein [Ornithobacterium rhinotracheale]MRJ11647.1 hypothetical protein [Ornithobacterium rhinotracheale]